MKPYRFSPIRSKEELLAAVNHTHFECYKLCKQSFGHYFANAQNIGIFCHYDDEYALLIELRKQLTETSDNLKQKYFRLHEPIAVSAQGDVPKTTYSYLYIRKPDPYRSQVGDIDFYVMPEEYEKLKQLTKKNKFPGARVFDRTDLDMIELYDPDIDALAYVSTSTIAKSVRAKLSEAIEL